MVGVNTAIYSPSAATSASPSRSRPRPRPRSSSSSKTAARSAAAGSASRSRTSTRTRPPASASRSQGCARQRGHRRRSGRRRRPQDRGCRSSRSTASKIADSRDLARKIAELLARHARSTSRCCAASKEQTVKVKLGKFPDASDELRQGRASPTHEPSARSSDAARPERSAPGQPGPTRTASPITDVDRELGRRPEGHQGRRRDPRGRRRAGDRAGRRRQRRQEGAGARPHGRAAAHQVAAIRRASCRSSSARRADALAGQWSPAEPARARAAPTVRVAHALMRTQ